VGCQQTIAEVSGGEVFTKQPTRFNLTTGSYAIVCVRKVETWGGKKEHECRRENPLPALVVVQAA
jgi:hypothetical protein